MVGRKWVRHHAPSVSRGISRAQLGGHFFWRAPATSCGHVQVSFTDGVDTRSSVDCELGQTSLLRSAPSLEGGPSNVRFPRRPIQFNLAWRTFLFASPLSVLWRNRYFHRSRLALFPLFSPYLPHFYISVSTGETDYAASGQSAAGVLLYCGRKPPSHGDPGGADGAEFEESYFGREVLLPFSGRTLSSLVSEYGLV